MRQLHPENPCLVVLSCVTRTIKDPSKGGLNPSHACRVELRATKLLVLNCPLRNLIVVSLIEVHTLVVPLAAKNLYTVTSKDGMIVLLHCVQFLHILLSCLSFLSCFM